MGLVSTKLYGFVVITFMTVLLVHGSRTTMKDFEKAVNAATNGTFVCFYDLTICNKSRDVCSNKTKTCHDAFGDISEEEIDKECEQEMVESSNFIGRRDVCIYRRGLKEVPQCPVWTTPFGIVFALLLISVAIAIFIISYHKRLLPGKAMAIVACLMDETVDFKPIKQKPIKQKPIKQNRDNGQSETEGDETGDQDDTVNPQAQSALLQARKQAGEEVGEPGNEDSVLN